MNIFLRKIYTPYTAMIILAAILYVAAVFMGVAKADDSTNPDAQLVCSQMNQYGFTAGIVYCIQNSIASAVAGYVSALQQKLSYYEAMMMAVAIIVFGIKLMNQHVEAPKKEATFLILRIMIGVFFYSQASSIYTTIAGPNGMINETVAWITGFSSDGSISSSGGGSGNMFSSLVSSNCTTNGSLSFQGIQIWQAFDCLFSKLFGAANPAQHPYAFGTSVLVVIGAALLSATMGVMIVALGLLVLGGILLLLFRALFLVLLSYMCIGFLAILAPLLAPLIFFDSKFLNDKFKRWLGMICSCFFQPVFVIGFLAMAIVTDDQLIEGTLSNCTPPTFPTSSSIQANAPALGWGQDGSGVCSFTQLFNQGNSGSDSANLQNVFSSLLEQNATILNTGVQGDTQEHKAKDSDTYNGATSTTYPHFSLDTGMTNVVNITEQFLTNTGNIHVTGTRIKSFAPLRQFMLTLLTFIFVTWVMYELMDIIPKMASQMTFMVGLELMSRIKVPAEDIVRRAYGELDQKAMSVADGKGIIPQLVNQVKTTFNPDSHLVGSRSEPK